MTSVDSIPISRSCHGCAAMDLLVIEESILSFRGGCEVVWDSGALVGVSIGGAITVINNKSFRVC